MNEHLPKEEISANEVWLVRIRDNATLTKVRVWNKYIKTVELKMVDGIGSSFYTWNDVEFVERICNAPERTGYERMFHSAVAALAEISDALGIPEDVASTANGNAEILHAIAELKARASHARDALREQRRERLRDAPGGDEPDDDGPCPDRRCTGF